MRCPWAIVIASRFVEPMLFKMINHDINHHFVFVQLDGNSHVIYAEEEAAGTRLLIDGRTCLLQVPKLLMSLIYSILYQAKNIN